MPSDRIGGSEVMAVRVQGDSMQGAGIHNGDDVIVRLQPVAEDGDIVVISAWGPDEPEPGKAKVKKFRRRGKEPWLESDYGDRIPDEGDRSPDEAFQSDRHRILGKVIGIYRPLQ
jgi:repressor LexA